MERAPYISLFNSKVEIHNALRDLRAPFTLIMANNGFQNDLVYREPIPEEGIYPQPSGNTGLKRVDIRQNAAAMITSTQALLAANAGAWCVSPFIGRLDDISWSGMELIRLDDL